MNDILIIRNNPKDFVGKIVSNRGYQIMSPYIRDHNITFRWIRRMHFRLNFPKSIIWFNRDIEKVVVNTIIIFESLISKQFLKWLRTVQPNARIIIWYWNIVDNTLNPKMIKDKSIEKWSFSRKDSLMYGMKFNPAPYFKEVSLQSEEPVYDIVFVGKDKGRLKNILAYQTKFEKLGMSTKFIITPENKWKSNRKYHKPIPYSDVLKLTSKSKAIFDFIEITDSGQSMRVYESLFNQKKLITNNQLIADYDFYDKKNIFILNIDNIEGLKSFVNGPYKKISNETIMNYDFENWINRFFIKDEKLLKMMSSCKLKGIIKSKSKKEVM